jgi:hypothetical protein
MPVASGRPVSFPLRGIPMQQKYLTRMLTARNPRYRRIAERLIAKSDRQAIRRPTPEEQIEHLRNKYRRLTGKTADRRWNDTTLLSKVLAAQNDAPSGYDTRDEIANALDRLESNP